MSNYTLTIPEDIYIRAQQIAKATAVSVDEVMIEYLRTLATAIPELPQDEEEELEALRHLSDDALWTIAREEMADNLKAHMQTLMDKNSSGSLTPQEYTELTGLVERGQRLMVRKSEAAALLTQRGYKVLPKNLSTRE